MFARRTISISGPALRLSVRLGRKTGMYLFTRYSPAAPLAPSSSPTRAFMSQNPHKIRRR